MTLAIHALVVRKTQRLIGARADREARARHTVQRVIRARRDSAASIGAGQQIAARIVAIARDTRVRTRQGLETSKAIVLVVGHQPFGVRDLSEIVGIRNCLNTLWPRRQLGWKTSAEAWQHRATISAETRNSFQKEVQERTHKIACSKTYRSKPEDLAERLAIEQTLEHMGYMHRQIGGWC